jgi:uncharacterized protein (DUF849 family)
VHQLLAEDLVARPPFVQVCLGIRWGAPATPTALRAFVDALPAGAVWPTTNAALVTRAVEIVEGVGGRVAGPAEARERLGLA